MYVTRFDLDLLVEECKNFEDEFCIQGNLPSPLSTPPRRLRLDHKNDEGAELQSRGLPPLIPSARLKVRQNKRFKRSNKRL